MQAPPPTLPTTWVNSLTQPHDDDNNTTTTTTTPTLWPHSPSTLLTTSHPKTLTLGTGTSIYDTLTPHLTTTTHELLLVTCFWAPSPSLTALTHLLRHLSTKSLSRPPHTPPIRVRIGLSSRSLVQKLTHTASLAGHVYAPATWVSQLGLPAPEELRGLDLQVKSVFVRPFSVMHPKFVVVDRRRAWLPSCNVSGEAWFEGCVELEGPVVGGVVEFWRGVWGGDDDFPALPSDPPPPPPPPSAATSTPSPAPPLPSTSTPSPLPQTATFPPTPIPTPTILLPSPPHRNPHFRPLPCQPAPPPPPTPLNTFLLHAFHTATRDIYIQTPNLTAPPVLAALLAALARGVDVHVVTNRRLMVLEQLVTAGTVTEVCVWGLVRRHRRLMRRGRKGAGAGDGGEEEEGRGGKGVGRLRVGYYRRPAAGAVREGWEAVGEEPVKSHLKMTVVDAEVVVLGSGNMDRASWYTSQELGVAFFSAEMAGRVLGLVRGCLVGRVEEYYCSS